MRFPTLDSLLLSDDERAAARRDVEVMAFCKWQDAGCPENSAPHLWEQAELEWIEFRYVPDRYPN